MWYREENGTYTKVSVEGGTVYYQQRSHYPGKNITAFPRGFRMTAGNPSRREYKGTVPEQAVSHHCLNYNGPEPVDEKPELPNVKCPSGIRSQVYFPSCWNGKDLDSPNHQNHMAYPTKYNGGDCPDSHPQPVMGVFFEFWFNTQEFEDKWYGDKQPFVYSNGDDTGYGMHGDFWSGWDVDVLQRGIDLKISEDANCARNVLCDNIFEYTDNYGQDCRLPSLVDEPSTGTLQFLPGCNKYGGGTDKAEGCEATETLKMVTREVYTDVSQTHHFKYIGCGKDEDGQGLDTHIADSPSMTVGECVDKCKDVGWKIAGS